MNALRIFTGGEPGAEGTVAALVDLYLASKEADALAGFIGPGALKTCRNYLRAFRADFGAQQLTACRRGDLKAWIARHPEWGSPHTQHGACQQVVSAFKWAEAEALIPRCPYSKPKELPALQPREAANPADVRKVLAAARGRGERRKVRKARAAFRLILWFLWETGCRTKEARDVCWEHYDDERGCFELDSKTTRKTGRTRIIVLSRRAWRLVRWLRRVCKNRIPSGPVFTNGLGKPWTDTHLSEKFRQFATAAGVPASISAYSTRHGFCCERLQAGVGERQVADLMGHASTRMVAWYGRGIRRNVDYLRESLEKGKE